MNTVQRYKTAEFASWFYQRLGILLFIISILGTLICMKTNNTPGVVFWLFGGPLIGFFTIASGQLIKALIDTANNSFEMMETTKNILTELQKKVD